MKSFTANGTPIQVIGKADMCMIAKDNEMFARVLVSRDVSEITLGITWLVEKRVLWELKVDDLSNTLAVEKICSDTQTRLCKILLFWHPVHKLMFLCVQHYILFVCLKVMIRQLQPGLVLACTDLPDQHCGV